jgi:hypothetical protein
MEGNQERLILPGRNGTLIKAIAARRLKTAAAICSKKSTSRGDDRGEGDTSNSALPFMSDEFVIVKGTHGGVKAIISRQAAPNFYLGRATVCRMISGASGTSS